MYSYDWDSETGGLVLNTTPLQFSKEPRPVYARELDILGFDRHLGWSYPKNGEAPLLWAEANAYWYRGRKVAQTKGGSLHTAPELVFLELPEPDGSPLRPVDVPAMVEKNKTILDALVNETVKRVFNVWSEYREKVDAFHVAFSGGKDSIVLLDVVQRALPHEAFKVVFGDTLMKFPDTYDVVEQTRQLCNEWGIDFHAAQSKLSPDETWLMFGPPSKNLRWCCSVHKTSPQLALLRAMAGKDDYREMAFVGIRGDESLARSKFETLTQGTKHKGQFSFNAIDNWNSAEVFLHLFATGLPINECYKSGISRAGCLLCPMSGENSEFLRRACYPELVEKKVGIIKSTLRGLSSEGLENGDWKGRVNGRDLILDQRTRYEIQQKPGEFLVGQEAEWVDWMKTIGAVERRSDGTFVLHHYRGGIFPFTVSQEGDTLRFTVSAPASSADGMAVLRQFRGVLVKAEYCRHCGVCEANCPFGCLKMDKAVSVSSECRHCLKCHDVDNFCLLFNSIRKPESNQMKESLDRYLTFGVSSDWVELYMRLKEGLWKSPDNPLGSGKVRALKLFLKDAGLSLSDKNGTAVVLHEIHNEVSPPVFWALLLCNLVYTPQIGWLIRHSEPGSTLRINEMENLLAADQTKHTVDDVIASLRNIMLKTPLGNALSFARPVMDGKKYMGLERGSWATPDPLVILYSLYKFAEAGQGGYYDFSLGSLMQEGVERDGVSPAQLFGIDRDTMEGLVKGLSVNHPDFVSVSFSLGLDNIRLNPEKRSTDVLALFH